MSRERIPLASELSAKIRKIETQLDQLYQYKQILAEDGLKPDDEDKARESRLVLTLRKYKKMAEGKWQALEDKPTERPRPRGPHQSRARPQRTVAKAKPKAKA